MRELLAPRGKGKKGLSGGLESDPPDKARIVAISSGASLSGGWIRTDGVLIDPRTVS